MDQEHQLAVAALSLGVTQCDADLVFFKAILLYGMVWFDRQWWSCGGESADWGVANCSQDCFLIILGNLTLSASKLATDLADVEALAKYEVILKAPAVDLKHSI